MSEGINAQDTVERQRRKSPRVFAILGGLTLPVISAATLIYATGSEEEGRRTIPSDNCHEIDTALTDAADVAYDQIIYDACKLAVFWRHAYPDLHDTVIADRACDTTAVVYCQSGAIVANPDVIGARAEGYVPQTHQQRVIATAFLAHEYGHGIDQYTGSFDDPGRELRADCRAGAYMADLPLIDLTTASRLFEAVGTEGSKENASYGTGTQRAEAFSVGVRLGEAGCLSTYPYAAN